MKDLRYLPRWEVRNRVVYQLDHAPKVREGLTRDISAAGTCISIDEPLLPAQKIRLKIQLSLGSVVNLLGNVVWVKRMGEQMFAGVSFYNTSEQAQQLILEHAFELDRKRVINQWFGNWGQTKNIPPSSML